MKEYYLNCSQLKEISEKLNVGDKIYLSGCVYTARDAAHKRILESIQKAEPLPFDINGAFYHL